MKTACFVYTKKPTFVRGNIPVLYYWFNSIYPVLVHKSCGNYFHGSLYSINTSNKTVKCFIYLFIFKKVECTCHSECENTKRELMKVSCGCFLPFKSWVASSGLLPWWPNLNPLKDLSAFSKVSFTRIDYVVLF